MKYLKNGNAIAMTIALLLFAITTFSQSTQKNLQRLICEKSFQAADLFKDYTKKENIVSSQKALKKLDTIKTLLQNLNQDSLFIDKNTYTTIGNAINFFKEQDYKKILSDEKKAKKVNVKVDKINFMWSKENFMALYSLIRAFESIIDDWNQKLK